MPIVSPSRKPPKPAFLADQRVTAAQRGTITHRVLGQIDYALARQGKITQALKQLQQQGMLTDSERASLRLHWLTGFFSSPLGQRALAASEVHREWSFNLRGDQDSLIQGVIDLCFLENGRWVLADYKTDAADGDELLRRYGLQLQWYAKALSGITGIPVAETLIFSLRAGKCFEIPSSDHAEKPSDADQ